MAAHVYIFASLQATHAGTYISWCMPRKAHMYASRCMPHKTCAYGSPKHPSAQLPYTEAHACHTLKHNDPHACHTLKHNNPHACQTPEHACMLHSWKHTWMSHTESCMHIIHTLVMSYHIFECTCTSHNDACMSNKHMWTTHTHTHRHSHMFTCMHAHSHSFRKHASLSCVYIRHGLK